MLLRVNSNASRAILLGGVICGILDLTAAIVMYGLLRGRSPISIMQSVATGLLGVDAYQGGVKTAVLGVALHFLIASTAATVYYLASRKLTFLVRHAIVFGMLYGIAVYFFMRLIVLPLSAFPHQLSFAVSVLVTGLLIHIFCVGLPISLAIRQYSK